MSEYDKIPVDILKIILKYYNYRLEYYYKRMTCLICGKVSRLKRYNNRFYFFDGSYCICDNCSNIKLFSII